MYDKDADTCKHTLISKDAWNTFEKVKATRSRTQNAHWFRFGWSSIRKCIYILGAFQLQSSFILIRSNS